MVLYSFNLDFVKDMIEKKLYKTAEKPTVLFLLFCFLTGDKSYD